MTSSEQVPGSPRLPDGRPITVEQARKIAQDAGLIPGDPSPTPPLAPPQAEQRIGEAIFGPGYVGPATAEAKDDDPYAPTTWGSFDEEVVTSSGQKCRVRKLDFQAIIESGMVDKLNTLQGVVDKNIRKGEGRPPVDPLKMLQDKRTTKQMTLLIDNVVCMVVTAPKVEMPPEDFGDRKQGVVYADTIGLLDKMDIFNHTMGDLTKLTSFRGESSESTGGVADE